MFSAFIQKPEEFLEGVTNLYNQTAFIKMTRHYIKQNEKFLVISIILDDTLFISNAFGINQMNSFLKKVVPTHDEIDRSLGCYKNLMHLTLYAVVFGFFIGQIILVYIGIKFNGVEYYSSRVFFTFKAI